jgi:predicted CXXCH cytochrome family protein
MTRKSCYRLMAAFVVVAVGTAAIAGITGSKHDFSSETWAEGQICLPCHVPHNAMTDGGGVIRPLWNHVMTTATFDMYPTVPAGRQPATESKLCLSCHDGTVAVDSFGDNTGTTFITGDALLGTDLSDDHPIAVTYPAPSADDDFVDDPTLGDSNVKLVDIGGGDLRVECTSCHDPHDGDTVPEFLRDTMAGSLLCLRCHDK